MAKVLYLTPGCFDKGGISRYNRYQIGALASVVDAENLRSLSLVGPGEDAFETPFAVTWHSATSHATNFGRLRFALEAFRHVTVWKPDVILSAHVNFGVLVSRLSAISGATTLLNAYGLELWSGLSRRRLAHMARFDHVISDCHSTAEHIVRERMHSGTPEVIWDCVDLETFRPGPLAEDFRRKYGLAKIGDGPVVLTLGRLAVGARHKGYDRLLEIWPVVQQRVPGAQLLIAGRGDDADRLKQKATALGVSSSVWFTGSIDEADLPATYRLADVFCLVSDKGPNRGEGIPLTPLEAMASGVPILVGDEDGSLEAVDGDRNGFVVSPRDPNQMENALVKLLTEPASDKAHRQMEARRVAEERFSYQAFATKHRELFKRLGLIA